MIDTINKYIELYYGDKNAFYWWNEECLNNIFLEGKEILDIGCGDGIRTTYIALTHKPQKIVAIDEYEGRGS